MNLDDIIAQMNSNLIESSNLGPNIVVSKRSVEEVTSTRQLHKLPLVAPQQQEQGHRDKFNFHKFLDGLGIPIDSSPCTEDSDRDDEEIIKNEQQGTNSDDNDQSSDDEDDEGLKKENEEKRGHRRSAEDLKHDALSIALGDALTLLQKPCNRTCHLRKECTHSITCKEVLQERLEFFGPIGKPAPTDRERAEKILHILRTRAHRDSDEGNLSFSMGKARRVCTAAFLRIIGLSQDVEVSKAPGQFLRLMKGVFSGKSEEELKAEEKIKIDASEKFSRVKGFQQAYIHEYCQYYADSIPTVKSEKSGVDIRCVPFRKKKDFYRDYCYSCDASDPPVPPSERGSYATFNRAFMSMYKAELVTLLGGKGTFQTCATCNAFHAFKKKAAANRDMSTIKLIRKLQRQHLQQQQIERQHAENFINIAKHIYKDDNPEFFYIDWDGQTQETTKAPKIDKDKKTAHVKMENRNIGVRIVCGPIDEYLSICIGDLIPGGANVMIECVRIAIETLAAKLAALPKPLVLPRKGGLNADNCGEQKNKEFMCWLSHLIESRYFDELEFFFLIVGHTHNPVDQWFSIISKCIRNADFIGSVIAMQELFKYACSNNEKTKSSEITVIQLTTYRDYRNLYAPVLNTNIKNFNLPCRYKFSLHKVWGSAYMQYMMVSPKPGWACKWLPLKPPADQDSIDNASSVLLTPYMLFNGEDAMLNTLEVESSSRMRDVVNASTAVASTLQDVISALSYIRDIEVHAIAENSLRMDQEADSGKSNEKIDISKGLLKSIEEEMLSKNTNNAGYIVWLKRSQFEDPEWLNTTPAVLPNPKKWAHILSIDDHHTDDILQRAESSEGATVVPLIVEESSVSNQEHAPSGKHPKKKKTPEEKKAAEEKKEALTRYLAFKNGVANMVRTANYVLELLGGQLEESISSDIVTATAEFSKKVLTSREVAYYKSIKTTDQITTAVEALVAQVESEPWELLRLPAETEELKARRQQIAADRKALEATVTANITRILTKRGTDSLEEILTREGKMDVYITNNVDDMNKDQIKILAKAAGIKLTGVDKKQKGVAQLRAEVKKYMSEKAISADTLLGAASSSNATISPPTHQEHSDTVTSNFISCTVVECEFNGSLVCPDCQLQFCQELHSTHNGHRNMQLKSGHRFPNEEVLELDDNDTMAETLEPVAEETFLETSFNEASDHLPLSSAAPIYVAPTANQLPPAPAAKKQLEIGENTQSKKRRDRGKQLVDSSDLSPIQKLAQSLRLLVEAGTTEDVLKSKLNYSSYDVAFLLQLADSLDFDVSDVMSCRRPTRGQISDCIISQLLS